MKIRTHSKVLILFAFCMQAFILLPAQSNRIKKDQQKENALISRNLHSYISVLASDSLEGRLTGSPGELKAVNFLVEQYRKLGIKPAGNRFIQPFEIDEGKFMEPATKVSINNQALVNNKDFFPLAWSSQGMLKDISSVALHEIGAPWWFDLKETLESNASNPHFWPEQYLKNLVITAATKGATAVFVYNSGSKPDSIAFNRKDKTSVVTIPVLYITKKAIEKLNINALSSPSIDVVVGFSEKKRTGHNVMAYLDNGAAQTIILGAHLDHIGFGEDENSRSAGEKEIHNGADDNASGTAAVLELARLIKEKTTATGKKKDASRMEELRKNNYLFIHFSGEELGLFGSKYFTEHPVLDLASVNYMMNMDMIGRLNDSSKLIVGGVGTSPVWREVLPSPATYNLYIKMDSSGSGPSDHTSFYRKNIPVLNFFTGLHNDYHKPGDDAEKINYKGETIIINYILNIIENTAAAGKLAFTKTREQTMTGNRYKVSVGIMPDYTFSGLGVRADGVIDGRPAQLAGMQSGDVIIELGGIPVSGIESYMQALNRFDKGESTTLTIKRGEEIKILSVTF